MKFSSQRFAKWKKVTNARMRSTESSMLRLSMVEAKRRKALSDSFSESTLSTALIASSSKGARVVDKSSGPALIASTNNVRHYDLASAC